MSNRFDNIPKEQSYVSSYVPLPINEILKVGAMKQQQYDKGIEDLQTTQDLIKINADPKHQEYANQLRTKYNERIAQLADEYMKTGGSPDVAYKTKALQREFANDQNRLQLESNYKNYLKYQEDAVKHRNENKYWEGYDVYDQLQVGTDKPTAFNYAGMKTITDFYKPAHDMMSGIKASGYDSDTFNFDQSGNIIGIKKGKEEVARKDINRVALSKVPLFLSHQDSRYFIDRFIAKNPNATQQDLNKAAYDYLRSEGENQIFSKSSYAEDFNYAPPDIRNKENNLPFSPGATPEDADLHTAKGLNTTLNNLGFSNSMEIDEKGNLIKATGKQQVGKVETKWANNKIPTGSLPLSPTFYDSPKEASTENFTKDLVKLGNLLGIRYNTSIPLPEYQTKVGEAFKKMNTLNSDYTMFDAKTVESLNKYYGIKTDENGTITDPASLSLVELKDANGNLLKSKDTNNLPEEISKNLMGARLLGSAKSIDSRTSAGDILVQATDGKKYYLNTGNRDLNRASEQSHNMYSSLGNYLNTGKEYHNEKVLSKSEINNLKNSVIKGIANDYAKYYPKSNFNFTDKDIKITNMESVGDYDVVTALIPDETGSPRPKNIIIFPNGEHYLEDLGQTAARIDSENLKEPLKLYNN